MLKGEAPLWLTEFIESPLQPAGNTVSTCAFFVVKES